MVATVAVGCVPFLHTALSSQGGLSWLGGATHSLGQCQIVLSTVVMGASLCNAWMAEQAAAKTRRVVGPTSRTAAAAPEPPAVDAAAPDACSSDAPRARDHPGSCDNLTFIATACALRLAVLPALCLPLHLLMSGVHLLPADPVLLMVLTISVGTPSSQTLVMVLNASGETQLAEQASKVYVPMYLLAVLSVACLIFVCCIAIETMAPHGL